MVNTFSLFLLQTNLSDFSFGNKGGASKQGLYVAIFFLIIIVIVIIVNNAIRKTTGGGSSSNTRLFSRFGLQRLLKNFGLNHEQIKMLNFVFKTDEVFDYEKSLSTSSLLDRHFRRAYRVIEQTSKNAQEIQRRHAILFSTRNILETSPIGSISATRQIRDDTELIINTGKDKIKVVVLANKAEYLAVNTPKTVLGSLIKIEKGTRLNILFFSKSNKSYSFETRVTGYSTVHSHQAMQLAHSNQIKFLSQRRFRRKQAVIACFMSLVYVEGTGKKQRLIVDKRRINGNIADISVGGCSIKTTAPVQVGARFKIEFTQGQNNVTALGQILRTNRTGVNTIIYIKFIRVTQKSMNTINAFVYEYTND